MTDEGTTSPGSVDAGSMDAGSMDAGDLELFDRGIRHATDSASGRSLDEALVDLGWSDALRIDPRAAVSVLFGHQGHANATSSALDQFVLHDDAWSTDADSGVVLPAVDGWTAPGVIRGDRLTVRGLATAAISDHDHTIVVAAQGSQDVAFTVPTADLTLRSIDGIDPWLGLVEVTGTEVATAPLPQRPAQWPSMTIRGQLALSHELIGASRAMLDQARTHALEREQFGRPIAQFQAIRHRLADTLTAIEAADAILAAAWDDGTATTTAMAKSMSGRAARTAAKHCQQVLAGIGFTIEHPLHRYVKRVHVLDELFGSARAHTRALGTQLVETRALPAQLPL